MSSRTCRSPIRKLDAALVVACLGLVSVTAGGCVLGNDNDRPVLAVDPLWDLAPGGRFSGDTCRGAGVVGMTWKIADSRGHTLEESKRIEDCKPLDFLGLVPGTYRVSLAGYDRHEEKLWETDCPPYTLGRFDVLETCEVDQIASGGSDGDRDAGEPADASAEDAGR